MNPEQSPQHAGQQPSIAETTGLAKREGTIVDRARAFARTAHEGQQRDDGRPYHTHPEEVVAILRADGVEDPIVLAAAHLHDVLEHTPTPCATLLADFGPEVTTLVSMLTIPELPGPTIRERHTTLVEMVVRMSPLARHIKLADRLTNLSHMTTWTMSERREYAEVTIPLLEALRPWPSETLAGQIDRIVRETLDQPRDG